MLYQVKLKFNWRQISLYFVLILFDLVQHNLTIPPTDSRGLSIAVLHHC